MAETMEAWMAPTVEAFSPQCSTWPGTKMARPCRRARRGCEARWPGESAAEAIGALVVEGGEDAHEGLGVRAFDGPRDDADVGDAGLLDGVHDGGEGAEGDLLIGAHEDDALGVLCRVGGEQRAGGRGC